MIIDDEDFLIHYGIKRRSGRYPWGSGDNPQQRSRTLLGMIDELKQQGLSEAEIARGLGFESTTDFRAVRSIAKNMKRAEDVATAVRLKNDKQMSNTAIAEQMGINESSVRALLSRHTQDTEDTLAATASLLKREVDKQGYLDIGTGVEMYAGVSDTRLRTAVAMLKEDGYVVHNVQVDQLGTGQKTTIKVLAPEGTTYRDIVSNPEKIGSIAYKGLNPDHTPEPPYQSLDSKRIAINYDETGGTTADGTIYLRRGAEGLDLGNANYAQVRIAVDGTHYIKGMAMYVDNLPDGVDVQFNTNKTNTGNKLDALKPLKTDKDGNVDWDNPFGAEIKEGGRRGVLNVVNEEGDWDKWSRTLSSQMLSKQPNSLAKAQLDARYLQKKAEYDEIMALTNPAVKRTLLEKFAEDADSSAVHLKAAALPGQRTQVILPMNSMKDNEIYAPNYRNGDKVVLVRYPHGGTFEIPELTVNNRNPTAKSIMGNALDAVGINHKVAERLSGADFDGDTVLVIPNNQGKVKSTSPLAALKDYDPKKRYPGYEGIPKLDDAGKQRLMGDVSNLITDMTIQGAPHSEIARAVKHSMTVIDAEKHNLDWRTSAKENGIAELKEKYQGRRENGRLAGASTIISRAQSEVRVPERVERAASKGGRVDPNTGKIVYEETGATYTKTWTTKTGQERSKVIQKTTTSKALAEVDDAHKLSSGTPMESIYADHSNRFKALANTARKEALATPNVKYSPSANKTYAHEVSTLKAKLNVALKNAPLERKAQLLANATLKQKRQANPDMTKSDEKKVKGKALKDARHRTGADKQRIEITPREWEAIQAGAVSHNFLTQVLRNTDTDRVKELATPRARTVMTDTKMARARAMQAAGYTQADIAAAMGIPVSTINDALK